MKRMNFGLTATIWMAFVLISCSTEIKDEKENSYSYYGLNQPVKSLKVTTYEADSRFGDVIKGDITWKTDNLYFITFKGDFASEKCNFYKNGKVCSKHIYTYDNENWIAEDIEYDANDKIVSKTQSSKNGDFLTKITTYCKEKTEIKWEYKLNGTFITEWKQYENGEFQGTGKNIFKSGKLSKYKSYDKEGNESLCMNYSYDNNVTLVNVTYNGVNKQIRVENNEKNLISYLSNAIETTTNMWSFFLDDEEGDTISFEYEYDERDNWIKRVSYKGPSKKPKEIVERVIVY